MHVSGGTKMVKTTARKMFGLGLAVTGLLGISALVPGALSSASARALYSPYSTNISDVQTGLCLDSNYNGNAYTHSCNGGTFQIWTVDLDAVGSYATEVVDGATGKCLDSNYSGNVYTLSCNGGSSQQLYFSYMEPTTIVNTQTGQCLDSNYNGNLYTLPCNGGTYQQWYF